MNPSDHIPDEFNPDDFKEPRHETLETFALIMDELTSLREIERSSFSHPYIRNPETGWELSIDLSSIKPFRGDSSTVHTREFKITAWSPNQSPWNPNVTIDGRAKNPIEVGVLKQIISELQTHLKSSDNEVAQQKAAWLEQVLTVVLASAETADYLDEAIDSLLETSPFTVDHTDTYDLTHVFENGSTLWGHINPANNNRGLTVEQHDAPSARGKAVLPDQFIHLTTLEGVRYTYEAYADRPATLLIERAEHRIVHEVGKTDYTTPDTPESILPPLTIDSSQALLSKLAADRQEEGLGLKQVTEGKLKEFNAALRAAFDSGVSVLEPHPAEP